MRTVAILFFLTLLSACQGDEDVVVVLNCNDEHITRYDSDAGQVTVECVFDVDDTARIQAFGTSEVRPEINLSATAPALERAARLLSTDGLSVGAVRVGAQVATTTTLQGNSFTLPLPNDFSTTAMDFDITLVGQAENIGTVSITLDASRGVPSAITTFNDLRVLASVINSQIFSPQAPATAIDIAASAIDYGGGNYGLQFVQTEEGLSASISVSNLSANTAQIGLNPVPTSVSGLPRASNNYSADDFVVLGPENTSQVFESVAGASAAEVAAGVDALTGVSASARTDITLVQFVSSVGNLRLTVNGIVLDGASLEAISEEINSLSDGTLLGLSANYDASPPMLDLVSEIGDDIEISIASSDDGDMLSVVSNDSDVVDPVTLEADASGDGVALGHYSAETQLIVVGGSVDFIFDQGYLLEPPSIFTWFSPAMESSYTDLRLNVFSPDDPVTYNFAAATQIYDSLGVPHDLAMYFVKQLYEDENSHPNHWLLYVYVDGYDVGDPDVTLPPPENTHATTAFYSIYFHSDGTVDDVISDTVLVSNWLPRDENGQANGAAGPLNVLMGGSDHNVDDTTHSNFIIDLTGLTQFGTQTINYGVEQNGSSGE